MSRSNRRSVLRGIGAGTTALLGGVGVAGARSGRRAGASAQRTITELAAASDDFDTLVAALEAAGLASVLDSEDDQFTVFAPTDEAFADLLDALGISAEELLASDDLATILRYHVTEGRRYADSVVNASEVEMLHGGTVQVDGTTLNDGQADIVATDIEASNGVVHVIDGVLLP